MLNRLCPLSSDRRWKQEVVDSMDNSVCGRNFKALNIGLSIESDCVPEKEMLNVNIDILLKQCLNRIILQLVE